jgi:isopentenyldiphosphate isomerase
MFGKLFGALRGKTQETKKVQGPVIQGETLEAIYEHLKKEVKQEVPSTMVRFVAGKETLGYINKDTAMRLCSYTSDFRLTNVLTMSEVAAADFASRNKALNEAYEILLRCDLAYKNDELLDIRPAPFEPVWARVPRGLCRVMGLLTQSVHLTAYDAKGRLVMGKRAMEKKVAPGQWDCLAAGLVATCEEVEAAVYREAYEEAGLTTAELAIADGGHYIEERLVPEGWLREHVVNFDVTLNQDAKLNNHPDDVSEFAAKTEEEMLDLVRHGQVIPGSALCMIESLSRRKGKRLDDGFFSYRVLRPVKDYSYIV